MHIRALEWEPPTHKRNHVRVLERASGRADGLPRRTGQAAALPLEGSCGANPSRDRGMDATRGRQPADLLFGRRDGAGDLRAVLRPPRTTVDVVQGLVG